MAAFLPAATALGMCSEVVISVCGVTGVNQGR